VSRVSLHFREDAALRTDEQTGKGLQGERKREVSSAPSRWRKQEQAGNLP